MDDKNFLEKQESSIAMQVFTVSSGLIGVCFTVIGIINIIGTRETMLDEITAINALIFLFACIFSYTAMKTRNPEKRFLLEKRVDMVFISGLSLMVIICLFIAFNFFQSH